MSIMTYMA